MNGFASHAARFSTITCWSQAFHAESSSWHLALKLASAVPLAAVPSVLSTFRSEFAIFRNQLSQGDECRHLEVFIICSGTENGRRRGRRSAQGASSTKNQVVRNARDSLLRPGTHPDRPTFSTLAVWAPCFLKFGVGEITKLGVPPCVRPSKPS